MINTIMINTIMINTIMINTIMINTIMINTIMQDYYEFGKGVRLLITIYITLRCVRVCLIICFPRQQVIIDLSVLNVQEEL